MNRLQQLAGIEENNENVWGDVDDSIVYDTLLNMDQEQIISEMMSVVEENPSLSLLDFLKQYGKDE